jgi:hypothetical protein
MKAGCRVRKPTGNGRLTDSAKTSSEIMVVYTGKRRNKMTNCDLCIVAYILAFVDARRTDMQEKQKKIVICF